MRKWEQGEITGLDRRAIVLSGAVILGMALLLAIGLRPAGQAGNEEAAQAGSESHTVLAQGCRMIQHLSYTPCGHSLTRRQTLPDELVGKNRETLAAVYDLWQVTSFSADEVEMERALDMFCPEHMVLMPDDSGMLCVWQNRWGDALALVRELNAPVGELPDAYQEMLRKGKGFATQEDLDLWLESIDS